MIIYKQVKDMNRLRIDKRIQVIAALMEGTFINATCRITGVAKHTVLNLLRNIGCAAAAYHHRNVGGLRDPRDGSGFIGSRLEFGGIGRIIGTEVNHETQ